MDSFNKIPRPRKNLEAQKLPDTAYLSEYDLQTLAEDQQYGAEILERHPTVFFRPHDRTSSEHPTFWKADESGKSYLGLITQYGSHDTQQAPTFSEPRLSVRVANREVKKISDIRPEECAQAYQELSDPQAILAWLQKKYPKETLSLESPVTVYKIEYLNQENGDKGVEEEK